MTASDRLFELLANFEVAVSQSGVARTAGGKSLLSALTHLSDGALNEADAALSEFEGDMVAAGSTLAGIIANERKDFDNCKIFLLKAIDADDPEFDILCLTGDFSRHFGFLELAIKAYDRAIEIAPHASHAHLRRGQVYSEAGDVSAAIDDLLRATLLQPNLISAQVALGDEYRSANMTDAACKCYRAALDIDPQNAAAQSGLDHTLALVLPQWHSAMLNDTNRNQAFEEAIKAVVTPGCSVLDIGTGTGLLAMMASRAGAATVTGCESVGVLAETAKTIVNQNGFKNRISILHKRSQDMTLDEDIDEPADVLVAEIVDAGLLGENVLTAIDDARRRLCKPDVTIIPAAATVYAVPIESEDLAHERMVDTASGFDISLFNALRPNMYLQTNLSKYQWQMLSDPVPVFSFDFTQNTLASREESFRLTPHTDGVAHGVAFWFDLHLSSEITLSTSPAAPPTHWHQAVYTFSEPMEIKQNEPVRLFASHDERKITLSLET
ncbi:MAG: tetratricopeptide repeat protein [Alphaproteobacteria bacterium]|nr:tetratricopeptide repeat protein [Alphaproteobacteria bacterium]